jgi:hypothetical protein
MLQSGSHHGSLSFCLGLRMIPIPLLSETHETRHETAVGLSTSKTPTMGGCISRIANKYQVLAL